MFDKIYVFFQRVAAKQCNTYKKTLKYVLCSTFLVKTNKEIVLKKDCINSQTRQDNIQVNPSIVKVTAE